MNKLIIRFLLITILILLANSLRAETFSNTNTIPVGASARASILGVTSIDPVNRTAGVVIDATDKFGNKVRLPKTAPFNLGKLRSYYRQCLKSPAICLASVAMTEALVYYGYTVINNQAQNGMSGSYPDCVSVQKEINAEGDIVTAKGPIPCKVGPDWRGDYIVTTTSQMNAGVLQDSSISWVFTNPSSYATHELTYRYSFQGVEPIQDAPEISEADLSAILLSDPQLLQVGQGVYPDVFDSIEITESAVIDDLVNPSDTDPSTQADMSGVESRLDQIIDNTTHDLSIMPEHTVNDLTTIDAVLSNFYSRISNAPIVTAFGNIANVVSLGGTCSPFSIDLSMTPIGYVTTSIHCDLTETVRPILTPVMMIYFSIIGFRIFASS